MSDTVTLFLGKPLTRRETELAREAFARGVSWVRIHPASWTESDAAKAAARQFPLPKVTSPRVVAVPGEHYSLRVVQGTPWVKHHSSGLDWQALDTFGSPRLTINGARVLMDLLANPNETVEVES